ncbi:MAG: helix-turn-helix domain-containing protein [Lachnospiraceae bacterium]|nr:helix-turn-helix domain-containing protein [Lachnospiraceae bacterium]
MSEITLRLGQRIRSYRIKNNLSQEQLSELANCHPTYIGQIERGEKNATVESILRISSALNISLSELFDKIEYTSDSSDSGKKPDSINFPLECYELLLSLSDSEQEKLYNIIVEIENYKRIE